jgi:dynein heavy chain
VCGVRCRRRPGHVGSSTSATTTSNQQPTTTNQTNHKPNQKSWDRDAGCLRDSAPNALHTAMPVMVVRPVPQEQHCLDGYYACPVYVNCQRANVYCPLVSTFTLRFGGGEPGGGGDGGGGGDDGGAKWVLASVALLLQDELAA